MHRYNFDLPATLRLRELITEYGRMRRLEHMTPQRRGQRLNDFVAELLSYWGVDRPQANVRGAGEVDVAFAVDSTRFVLEAKWELTAVSFEPIAKLSRRITQRLAGTRGVFLSMSGYSDEALRDMLRGQQPDMLLLDRTHLEAMLSGLLSPHDLFTELVDRPRTEARSTCSSPTSYYHTTPRRCRGSRQAAHPIRPRWSLRRRPASRPRWCCTAPSRARLSLTAWPSTQTDSCC